MGQESSANVIPTASGALREPHTGLPMSDGFGCCVCVFIISSFQKVIVNHGLCSGFLLQRGESYKYMVNFY